MNDYAPPIHPSKLMHTLLAITQITTYFILLMLAGYLLNRSAYHPLGVATAGALIAFAVIQADQFLGVTFEGRATGLAQILWAAYPLPTRSLPSAFPPYPGLCPPLPC